MSAGMKSHLCIPTGLSLGTALTLQWLFPLFDCSEIVLVAPWQHLLPPQPADFSVMNV